MVRSDSRDVVLPHAVASGQRWSTGGPVRLHGSLDRRPRLLFLSQGPPGLGFLKETLFDVSRPFHPLLRIWARGARQPRLEHFELCHNAARADELFAHFSVCDHGGGAGFVADP